jgi:hypothetical protein
VRLFDVYRRSHLSCCCDEVVDAWSKDTTERIADRLIACGRWLRDRWVFDWGKLRRRRRCWSLGGRCDGFLYGRCR